MAEQDIQMNWNNLKRCKCPKCGGDVEKNLMTDIHHCVDCDFKISHEKFSMIADQKIRKPNRYVEPDRSNWQ